MSNYTTNDGYGRVKRRSSYSSDVEDKISRRQERSKSRDLYRRQQYHGSRSDLDRRDRSRSPYRNHENIRRTSVTGHQSFERSRRESGGEDKFPRRYRSTSPSSPELPRSPRDDRRRSNHSKIKDSQSPSHRRYESGSNYRQLKSDRKYSPSPNPRHRHRKPEEDHRRSKHSRHRSKSTHRHRSRPSPQPSPPPNRSKAPLPSQESAFQNKSLSHPPTTDPPLEKQKPNYEPSGKLAAETNTVANTSIVLKYHEPPSARLPPASAPWRLYIYKGADLLETLSLHTRSCWLFGRERLVVDVPTEHPSCSKQHAVIQFRHVETKNAFGDREGRVKPYVIDLDSANGTRVNGDLMPGRQYMELKSGDLVVFGESSREYVLLLPPKE